MNELQFSADIVIYLIGLAVTWGGVMFRIKSLEKKMDKHNCIIERMAVAENNIDALQKKIGI